MTLTLWRRGGRKAEEDEEERDLKQRDEGLGFGEERDGRRRMEEAFA